MTEPPTYRIAIFPGDGIGPEVVAEGLKVLDAAEKRFGFQTERKSFPWSGAHWLATKELMPDSVLDEVRTFDAVLLGAVGHPGAPPGLVERAVVGGLRWGLDLYANVRPVRLYHERLTPLKGKLPADIDFIVVRENTEDLYVGLGGFFKKGTPDEVATGEMIVTRKGTERVIRYAFELARSRPRKKLTLVDKANAVMAHDLWRRTFREVALEYPDVATDALYVDAAAMFMVQAPERFDVMVTTNMFGDILTDLGAMLQGGMGSAASANIHPGRVSLFEPIHGSAPDIAGTGTANPTATVLAVGMMLDFLGQAAAGALIEETVRGVLTDGRLPGLDARTGLSTTEIGDLLAGEIVGGRPIS
ncbi:MAG: 3-isopropylmalate dehydrogenase [Candidatus Eisenbacteria bacterium]|nr:3-isopropylmalate dehydrogenase [Candidatus Eisenbacteria bacterium]